MSFLNELQLKKLKLKPTTTIVTYADGTTAMVSSSDGGEHKCLKKTYGFIIDTKPDMHPACIIENWLYLGSQDACDLDIIKKFNITYLLSVGIESPPIQNFNGFIKDSLFVQCLDLPETQFKPILNTAIDFIEMVKHNNGILLIHCNAGVSRSASIVIGYLIKNHNYNFQNAYEFVKSKRECIRPNDGFLKQLKNL